jgi:hypothetical protein
VVLVTWFFLAPVARSNLAPSRHHLSSTKAWALQPLSFPARGLVKEISLEPAKGCSAESPKPEFRVTEQTEVKLDGRSCRYEEVPKDAVIIFIEAASEENRVILKIHFRSKR